MNRTPVCFALAFALLACAHAGQAADWSIKFGAHAVNPRSGNGTLAGTLQTDIDTDAQPSVMAEYFVSPNWGVELLAALPFQHDVSLDGVKAARIKHLPPTLSLQYHFAPDAALSPYIGVGVNYTWTFDEETRGPIDGTSLKLDNGWGLALHAGVDYRINERWFVGVDVRKIDIDLDARLDGAAIGTVHVDPLAYGAYVGYRF